jgi:hypothetical protein
MRLLLALLLFAPAALAQSYDGTWRGEILIPGQPLAFSAKIEGDLSGTLSIPAQNLVDYPLTDLRAEGDSLFFML